MNVFFIMANSRNNSEKKQTEIHFFFCYLFNQIDEINHVEIERDTHTHKHTYKRENVVR